MKNGLGCGGIAGLRFSIMYSNLYAMLTTTPCSNLQWSILTFVMVLVSTFLTDHSYPFDEKDNHHSQLDQTSFYYDARTLDMAYHVLHIDTIDG